MYYVPLKCAFYCHWGGTLKGLFLYLYWHIAYKSFWVHNCTLMTYCVPLKVQLYIK